MTLSSTIQRLKNIFVLSCTPCRIGKNKTKKHYTSIIVAINVFAPADWQNSRHRTYTLCALADVSITKDGTASAAVGLSSVLLTLTIQMTRILGLQEAFVGT